MVMFITTLGFMIIALVVFLLVLLLINKTVLKGNKKIDIKEFAIGWVIVLIINVCCVAFNAPFGLGIPQTRMLDGGVNKYYVSLGYTIHVYNPNNKVHAVDDVINEKIETNFEFLHEYFK